MSWFRAQNANEAVGTTELGDVVTKSERLAKRAKVVPGSGSSAAAPSPAAYSALLSERDDFKIHCEALMCKKRSTPDLAEEARQVWAVLRILEKCTL